MPVPSTDPRIGSVIGGCRLEALVGRGGMGVVYRAEQLQLGRRVAIKLIAPDLVGDEAFRDRFQREWRVAASIDHPHVVPIHEAGEDDGTLYIVMRFVEGTDLRQLLAEEGRLVPARAAAIVAAAGAALDAAHAKGLIHRDVKPANILLAQPGDHVYLTDFGLTKHLGASSGLTVTGQRVGTVDYMAPEQIEDRDVDARTDVYALGCVLHQTLTGNVPFERSSDPARMWAHMNDSPPAPSTVAPGIPTELDDVVARALAKNPNDRFPSAGDLGRAALAGAQGATSDAPERSVAAGAAAPVRADRPSGPAPPTRADLTAPLSAPPQPAEPRRTRRTRAATLAIAGVLLVAAGTAGAVVVTTRDDPKENAPETTPAETERADASPTPTETAPAPDPEQGYIATAYEATYPASWAVVEDEKPEGDFLHTRFESPDGRMFIVIDRVPGEQTDPRTKASQVEAAVAGRTTQYRRISLADTSIGGVPAVRWIFEQPENGRTERRVDYFFRLGGDGYAVLGGGEDYDTVAPLARRVAASIEPAQP